MNKITRFIAWATIYADICLIVGIIFTGQYGSLKVSAYINFGHAITSDSNGGIATILAIVIWTGVLAMGILLQKTEKGTEPKTSGLAGVWHK